MNFLKTFEKVAASTLGNNRDTGYDYGRYFILKRKFNEMFNLCKYLLQSCKACLIFGLL